MKREKRYLALDSFEWRLAIVGMNYFRNNLLRAGKPTEDVDALLLKLINAKTKCRESAHHIWGNLGEPLSQPPYGYVKSSENKKFRVVEPEAAAAVV